MYRYSIALFFKSDGTTICRCPVHSSTPLPSREPYTESSTKSFLLIIYTRTVSCSSQCDGFFRFLSFFEGALATCVATCAPVRAECDLSAALRACAPFRCLFFSYPDRIFFWPGGDPRGVFTSPGTTDVRRASFTHRNRHAGRTMAALGMTSTSLRAAAFDPLRTSAPKKVQRRSCAAAITPRAAPVSLKGRDAICRRSRCAAADRRTSKA